MSKKIPNIEDIQEPQVGFRYWVPCLKSNNPQKEYMPIIGNWHDDTDVIDIDPEDMRKHFINEYKIYGPPHIHVDMRFLPEEWFLKIYNENYESVKDRPTLVKNSDGQFKDCHVKRKIFTCYRSAATKIDPVTRALEYKYRNHKLKNLICPHQGFDLSKVKPDSDNCVTCPLHNLKFSLDTGRIRQQFSSY